MRSRRLRIGAAAIAGLPLGLAGLLAGPGGEDEFADVDWRPTPHAAAFAVRFKEEVTRNRVASLTVLPGARVELTAGTSGAEVSFAAEAAAGQLAPLRPGRWSWRAPEAPGLYPIRIRSVALQDSILVQAFVAVPRARQRGETLNGYRIGRYPPWTADDLAIRRPPSGFIEVTPEMLDVPVSPRFRLRQFLCKQEAGFPKYLVLDDRLPLKLEYLLDRVNEAGHRVETFHVMSGYRTPYYNRSIGNVRNSRHVWGAAADIFVDRDGDGVMDDLNGDGRIDAGDALVLYELVDRQASEASYRQFVGGLGKYGSTPAHGPFVHVDVRGGTRARW